MTAECTRIAAGRAINRMPSVYTHFIFLHRTPGRIKFCFAMDAYMCVHRVAHRSNFRNAYTGGVHFLASDLTISMRIEIMRYKNTQGIISRQECYYWHPQKFGQKANKVTDV